MAFATGPITFQRYYICGDHPQAPCDEWFEAVAARAFGRGGEATSDGIETGWIVPVHLFDVDFSSPERITVGRFLYLAMRVDRTAPPRTIVQSYRKMEEQAALVATGRATLTRSERGLARQIAADRAETEARDGGFRRIAAYPVLIDLAEGLVYFGNLGATAGDKLMALFADTFQTTLAPATVEEVATRIAESAGAANGFEDAVATHFAEPPAAAGEASTAPFADLDRSFWGREFLTWLWHRADQHEGLFELDAAPSVALAFHRSMRLACSRDLTGTTAILTDAPASSPEARAALRIGKQPIRTGLVISSTRDEWSLTLDGRRWSVSGLVAGRSEEEDPIARLEDRFNAIRDVGHIIDLLLARFLRSRLHRDWPAEADAIRAWAGRDGKQQTPLQRATA